MRKNNFLFLFLTLSLGFIIRAIASYWSVGYLHGDAHFQHIEPAFHKLYGYGDMPWEFWPGETVRSWFLPGIFYYILSFFHSIGLEDPLRQLFIIRIGLSLFSILGVYFSYKTMLLLSNERCAQWVAFFTATWAFLVYFNIQTHGETMNFPLIMMAFYLCLKIPKDSSKKSLDLLAGISFGLAFIFKFQVAPIGFPLIAFLMLKKEWKASLFWLLGISIVLIGHGSLDKMVYGEIFASLLRYGHLMLFTNHSSSGGWGSQPLLSYLSFLIRILSPLVFPVMVIFFLYGLRKIDVVSTSLIAYFFVHSWLAHKELRYAAPMVPLMIMASCKGFYLWRENSSWSEKLKLNVTKAVISLFIIGNLLQYIAPLVPTILKPTRPQWAKRRALCLATHYVGLQNDSKGVVFLHEGPPGMFYLHKNIPYLNANNDIDQFIKFLKEEKFNYVVFTTPGSPLTIDSLKIAALPYSLEIVKQFSTVIILKLKKT